MSYEVRDYWIEAVSSSLEEHGIDATTEQIKAVARDMENARDCIGLAFYQPENPLIRDVRDLEIALKHERELVHCRECNGTGRLVRPCGPVRWSDTHCDACNGKGKRLP